MEGVKAEKGEEDDRGKDENWSSVWMATTAGWLTVAKSRPEFETVN